MAVLFRAEESSRAPYFKVAQRYFESAAEVAVFGKRGKAFYGVVGQDFVKPRREICVCKRAASADSAP